MNISLLKPSSLFVCEIQGCTKKIIHILAHQQISLHQHKALSCSTLQDLSYYFNENV